MSRKTLFTTEGDVDLHGVYHRSKEARQRLDEKLTDLVDKRGELRRAEANFADCEVILAGEFRGLNPEMSQTQFDKQVKAHYLGSSDWCGYRDDIVQLKGEVEGLEADVSVLKRDIQIDVGRMISLGGYLFFEAADKLTAGAFDIS